MARSFRFVGWLVAPLGLTAELIELWPFVDICLGFEYLLAEHLRLNFQP